MSDNTSHLDSLPTEILFQIFHFLQAKDLIQCRSVCIRWKHIVDALTADDLLWRRYCRHGFKKVYQIARSKARCGLHWYHIYKSLTLWPKLCRATVEQDEFASASAPFETNIDVIALNNGILGVHKRSAIVYYDVETLQPCKRTAIAGHYLRYMENSNTIVVLGSNLSLFVTRKLIYNPSFEKRAIFDGVKMFHLEGQQLYYVTLTDHIYECDLTADRLTSEFQIACPEEIMCVSYMKNLHILTFRQSIYMLVNKKIFFLCFVNGNTLDLLNRFQFLESLDWRVYYQWLYTLNLGQPPEFMQDIITVKVYNDTVFVGTRWGILYVYCAPYVNGVFDFFKADPIRQWNFNERSDCPVLSDCPIVQIEAIEAEDGHTVLVVMPKKIVVLNFHHNQRMISSTKAVIPYSNYCDVKQCTKGISGIK